MICDQEKTKKQKWPKGVRCLVYSFSGFYEQLTRISKISKKERQMLVSQFSGVLCQNERLVLADKFCIFIEKQFYIQQQNPEETIDSTIKEMKYAVTLSNGLDLELEQLTQPLDYERCRFFEDIIYEVIKSCTDQNKTIDHSVGFPGCGSQIFLESSSFFKK